ncbi:MAG: helix-turn-helix domain-containing protein [Chlamydiota bacterium]
MNDDIKKVGVLLKAKRKELHLSLKEVENSTSIRASYLESIEEGRVSEFISSVYALGFMKQYAVFLGIDTDKMMEQHPLAFKMPAEKHEFSYGIGTLEVRGSMGGGVKWFPNLLWAGFSVVVIVIAWYAARYLGVL